MSERTERTDFQATSDPALLASADRGEAHLLALACGPSPEGRSAWSLRLLADRMVELGYADELSHETVRRSLKKANSSRT